MTEAIELATKTTELIDQVLPGQRGMASMGLSKVTEECGELVQVAAKKQACPDTDTHFDGSHLPSRMEEEAGDVAAAIDFMVLKFGLNNEAIQARRLKKLELFIRWDNGENPDLKSLGL